MDQIDPFPVQPPAQGDRVEPDVLGRHAYRRAHAQRQEQVAQHGVERGRDQLATPPLGTGAEQLRLPADVVVHRAQPAEDALGPAGGAEVKNR